MNRRLIGLLLLVWGCPANTEAPDEETAGDEDIMFPDEAEAQRADASHPASDEVRRGETQLAAGDVAAAQQTFEAAVARDADDARAHLDLALVLELQNDYAAAEAHYREALRVDPDFVEALNNLGLLLRDRERADEAVPMLQHAVELRADFGEAWLNLALSLQDSGDIRQAIEAYRRAVRLLPQDATARANLGLALLEDEQEGSAAQAAIELRRALPLARGDVATLLAIGNGLRRAGEAEGAVRAMEMAVEDSEPPTAALLAELALARRAAGDREGAERDLGRALSLDADFATGHYLLGSLQAARGAYAEAITHFQAYLRLEPSGTYAERVRAHLAAARRAR